MKRLELQEIKENLLRKWRGRASSKKKSTDNKSQIETKTKKVEEKLKRIEEENKSQDEKIKEWQNRRLKMIEEGREKKLWLKRSQEKERREKRKSGRCSDELQSSLMRMEIVGMK